MDIENLLTAFPTARANMIRNTYNNLAPEKKDAFMQRLSNLAANQRAKTNTDIMKQRETEAKYIEKTWQNPWIKNADPMALQNFENYKKQSQTIKPKTSTNTFKKNNPYWNTKVGTYKWKEVYKNSKWQFYQFTGKGGAIIIPASVIQKTPDVTIEPVNEDVLWNGSW